MKTHYFLPIAVMTLALLMESCTKEQDPILQNANLTPQSSTVTPEGASQDNPSLWSRLKPLNLGTAGGFAILSEYGIREPIPHSAITGDIGTSPLCGEGIHVKCVEVTGNIYITPGAGPYPCAITNPTLLSAAVNDMVSAYNYASGLTNPNYVNLFNGYLGNNMLRPGLYKWNKSLNIQKNISLYGGPDDVFIFQIHGTFNVGAGVSMTLKGGAQAKNIYWLADDEVSLQDSSHFEGILLTKKSVNLYTSASVNGRLLAQYEVVLRTNVVKQPVSTTTSTTMASSVE